VDSIESLKQFPKEGQIDWMSLLVIFGLGLVIAAMLNQSE